MIEGKTPLTRLQTNTFRFILNSLSIYEINLFNIIFVYQDFLTTLMMSQRYVYMYISKRLHDEDSSYQS